MSHACSLDLVLDKCDDLPDYFQKHVTRKTHPFNNKTHMERLQCMQHAIFELAKKRLPHCHCPLACKQTQFKIRDDSFNFNNIGQWDFTLEHEDTKVTKIIQVQDCTIEDLLGAVGGILGLTIGASSISVVELFAYFVLYIARKIY